MTTHVERGIRTRPDHITRGEVRVRSWSRLNTLVFVATDLHTFYVAYLNLTYTRRFMHNVMQCYAYGKKDFKNVKIKK